MQDSVHSAPSSASDHRTLAKRFRLGVIRAVALAALLALVTLTMGGIANASDPSGSGASTPAVRIFLHARRQSVSLHPGRSISFKIHVAAHGQAKYRVALAASGAPNGASVTFRPRAVRPGRFSTLTIRTASSTPAGRYTLRITASRRAPVVISPQAHVARISSVPRPVAGTVTVRMAVDPSPASSAPAPADSGAVPAHLPTWTYDDGCNGGDGASAALVQRWVTYAESHCGPDATKALQDCQASCTAVQYLDANWIYAKGSEPIAADAKESWWLHLPGHSDSGHRIYKDAYGGGNVLNQNNAEVQNWFKQHVQKNYNAYPALMMDDTGASLNTQLYYSGQTSSQEITSDAQLQASHERMAAAMTHADGSPFLQIANSVPPNPYLPTPFPMLGHSGTHGLLAEGLPVADGQLTHYYSYLLDEIAHVDNTAQNFIVLLSYDPSGSNRSRTIQAATQWLGSAGSHVVSWANLESDNANLSIWPEQGIVPTQPIQSMGAPGGAGCFNGLGALCTSGGHLDLQVAPGVYRREFRACYDQGTPFGDCAAITNTTGLPITVQSPWLTQSYSHQITFNGSDVQSGGTVNLTGSSFAPGSTTIPAHASLLLSN